MQAGSETDAWRRRTADAAPQAVLFGDYVEPWLPHYVTVACKPSPVQACAKGSAGLHWEDIQLGQNANDPHRFLHVQRTYDPVHHTFNTPKNGKSRRVDMSQELRHRSSSSATSVLMRPYSTAPRLSPQWCSVAPMEARCLPRGSTNSIGASVPAPGCMATASTISGIATRRSCSMSTMPPSSMSRSSWGMPASRSPWIPTDTLAKGPALPWPISLTPQERRRAEMQL